MKYLSNIRPRHVLLSSFLLTVYATIVFIVNWRYSFESPDAGFINYLRYSVEVGVFFLICSHFKGLEMVGVGLLSVALMSIITGLMHFYFSETYGGLDWSGLYGAYSLMMVHGAISLYILILTSVFVWIFKYLINKISKRMHKN